MANNWSYVKANDTISASEGKIYATIDGDVIAVAECKDVSVTFTKNKTEFKALGNRATQHKATGWSGSGTLTITFVTSRWVKLLLDYADTGVDQYFKLQIINDDPSSSAGKQKVTLTDVNLDSAEIAKLDTEGGILDSSIPFTFSGVELTQKFTDLN